MANEQNRSSGQWLKQLYRRDHPAYKNGQLNVSELARVCDLSRTTDYKYISLVSGE